MKSKKIYLSALILGLMGGISSAHSAFGMGGGASGETEFPMGERMDKISSGWSSWEIRSEIEEMEEMWKMLQMGEMWKMLQMGEMDKISMGGNPREKRFEEKKIGTHSSATWVLTLDGLKTLSYNPEHKDQQLRVGTKNLALKSSLIAHGAVESGKGEDVLMTQATFEAFIKSAPSTMSKELIRLTPTVKRENGK